MNEETHVMLDIETMGTGRDSRVIALGAARFDPFTGVLSGEFSVEFAVVDECGKATPSTVEWWSHEDRREAREYLDALEVVRAVDVPDRLREVFGDRLGDAFWWAKSPTFDMTILEDMGVRAGKKMPWHYRRLRDVRTVVHASGIPEDDMDWSNLSAPLHSPLADCEVQARHVARAIRSKWGLPGR